MLETLDRTAAKQRTSPKNMTSRHQPDEKKRDEASSSSSSTFPVPSDATFEPSDPNIPPASLTFGGGENAAVVLGKASLLASSAHNTTGTGRNYLLVGRQAATCDIRINHKSLSRQHAVLYYRPQPSSSSLWVVDLQTKSGTTVNGQRIISSTNNTNTATRLYPGDTIQFGKAQPIFSVEWNISKENNAPIIPEEEEPVGVSETAAGEDAEEEEEEEGPVLTGRAQRQAEIAAMMASLDEAPTYAKYVPTAAEEEQQRSKNQPTPPSLQDAITAKETRRMDKYKLPLQEATSWASVIEESSASSEGASSSRGHLSAIAMDPTGARFALGSMDSALRLYDFGGFHPDHPTPFQNVYVQEGYPVRSIAYAPSGDRYVVATGSSQPRLMDRDGEELLEFARGDVYVTDPSKTSGHTAAVTCIQWHPLEKSIVYTTSRDGSLRMWNVDSGKLAFGMLKCHPDSIIVIKNLKTGRKTIPTCMAICPKYIAMGTECGSIQIYAHHPFVSKLRPQQSTIVPVSVPCTKEGEGKATNTSSIHSIVYSMDGTRLACRTATSVHVYNTERKISTSTTPLWSCTNVGTMDETDNSTPTMAFSPNGKVLCIGVTEQQASKDGTLQHHHSRLDLYVMPSDDNTKKKTIPLLTRPLPDLNKNDSIVALSWHVRLNQILVATLQSFQLWYSVDHSQKGVLLSVNTRRKKRKLEDDLQDMYQARAPPPGSNVRYEQIIAPNALPMFGGDSKQKRMQKKLDQREEDSKRNNPQQPAKNVYTTHNTIFAQLVVDNQTVERKAIAGQDPREALAKYSEGKSYIGTAYEGNTERILADKTVEEEEDEMKKK